MSTNLNSKRNWRDKYTSTNLTYFERDNNNNNNNNNYLINYNRHHHKKIDIQRRILPIYKYRDDILYSIFKYRTTIILGETGSGKTTQIPQYLYESGWTQNNRMICCTQPRRISTISIANRVSKEMNNNDCIGDIVGYSIRFDSKLSINTRLKFITHDMLLSELLIDPLLSQYSVIILDEAHERSINIDLLFGLIKKILKIRLDLRLIISSATMDVIKFKEFFTFNVDGDNVDDDNDVNIICVEGKTYPVETFYLSKPCNNYIIKAVETVINIHLTQKMGDILVFLTGKNEIIEACQQCKSSKYSNNMLILPMYAGLSFNEQLKVFKKINNSNIRKVIFATNIAETSITIDNIIYVIDCGFIKLQSFDPISGISSLYISSISKSSSNQRKGRAGRMINGGKCYRLYTKESIYLMNNYNIPEIKKNDLTQFILKLKSFNIDNIIDGFDFISLPSIIHITYSLELLYALHLIDDKCKLKEPFGRIVSQLPCNPKMGVMLINSAKLNCSQEILSIVAMLSIKNIISIRHKNIFGVLEGDHLTYLNIFNSFILNNKDINWCKEHYLEYRSLKRAIEIRQLLKKYLIHFKIPLISCKNNKDLILKCIIKGYFCNVAQIQSNGSYKTIRGQQILYINKSSILYKEGISWIIFNEIQETDYIYMYDISAIKPTWLQQFASHFYQYK